MLLAAGSDPVSLCARLAADLAAEGCPDAVQMAELTALALPLP
jgi:hypothetical protein